VTVEETVTAEGYHAAFLRGMFKDVAAADRATALQQDLAPLGGSMKVQSLEIEHLGERDRPLVFKATYLVRGRFQAADDSLLGQLPALWEQMYLDAQPARDRRTPFVVEYPLDFSSTIDFVTPEGFSAPTLPAMTQQSQSPFVTWKMHAEHADAGLRIHYDLHLPAGHYSASQYTTYDEDMDRAVAALSQNIILRRKK
jgi:hypothetical protein